MADQDSLHQTTESEADAPDPFIGRVIVGKFRLTRLLGEGAMGRVYEAKHLSLAKRIAVKVLHQSLTGDEGLARRFHREAKSASTLNHPNSISIMDFGQDIDGTLFIVMEFLEGRSLLDVLSEEAPLPLDRTVRILSQVCLALDAAHHHKIIHRDLKAENVMVTDRRDEIDFVKVCDFGIAKVQDPKSDNPDTAITVAGMVCGTPEYMSPEQARGEPLDGRSDLYSLGILLYYMVTDRLPFTAETALGCVTQHLTEKPIPPREMRPELDIPPVLDAFILRTISKDPDLRPATATDFRNELAAVADRIAFGDPGEPNPSPTPTPALIETPPVDAHNPAVWRSGRAPLLVLMAVVLVAAGAAVYFLTRTSDAPTRETTPTVQASGPDGAATSTRNPAFVADAAASGASTPPSRPKPDAAVKAMDVPPVMGRPRRRRRRLLPVMRPVDKRPIDVRPDPRDQPPGKPPFQEASDNARAAFNSGRVSAAVRYYKVALRHKAGDARSIKGLGRCYVRLGQPCRALRYYQRYARLRPGDIFVKRHIQTLSAKCGGK